VAKRISWWDPAAGLLVTAALEALYLPLALLVWLVDVGNEPSEAQRADAITRAVLQAIRDDERVHERQTRPVTIPTPMRPFVPRPAPGTTEAVPEGRGSN
jgi:hypothetical protein